MVYYSTFWLNSFPSADGISTMLSPRAIIGVGMQIDFSKHCQLEFGTGEVRSGNVEWIYTDSA
eukprot:scaffold25220_cov34-Attheya_sp.AAC.3